jgi:hypothetical protein
MNPAPAVQTLPLRSLVCERCGTAFACGSAGADGSCWCMEENYRLPVPDAAAGDCLCPACLRHKASEARERTA